MAKLSELYSSNRSYPIIGAAELENQTFYIHDAYETTTKFGTRVVLLVSLDEPDVDEKRALLLSVDSYRRRLVDAYAAARRNGLLPVYGPVTIVKKDLGRGHPYWLLTDIEEEDERPVVEEDDLPF